ncbi:uncharacterized protein LOC111049075 [Nilaparvata lugens]|uniref:uncharacterized protein LOC111049075 n=1 Tax=Nilaparvata lugens TaxID=108931 RepID=UPI00193EAA1E|nr:uncharacterized protein LOC111049075 [Nilaparvata lugens]XP_039280233.1 uncharacterized protein LOC111049075 [Nilaparvata lugens]XP_039280234.1 uncharacterized protein LOC111049075 [Nilaparvata lugens]XP_039280235.1 uncharacterized protein LOC111049075 [Nilaparvata lugens]
MPEKKPLSFPPSINNGFMASYIKFLEGIQCDLPDEAVPTPKKEVRPQKREVPSTKKEVPSTKKEVPSAKKEVSPPKKEVAAARRSDESDETEEAEPEPPPKREPSTRRARRKSSLLKRVLDEDEEDGDDYNSANSDSDPAWSPAATKDDSDEDFEIRSERRTRRSLRGHTRWGAGSQRGRKRGRSSIASSNDEDDDDHLTSASKQRKYPTRTKSVSQTENKTNDGEGKADFIETSTNKSFEVFPFQVGEFVMNKSDVNQKNHPIWRVDGKTLLQKYQPTVQKGEIIYKNIPTYSGWTHRTNNDFQKVEVKIISQQRHETVVQLLVRETEELIEDQKAIDKYMEEYKIYQDAFEIYIQTLISQVLDSNFLMEIIRENDTYFLNSVKTIDEKTCDRRKQLSEFAKLQPMVEKSVATWPCIDVLQDSPQTDADISKEMCASCLTSAATKRVIVFGQPYNSDNLEGCPPDPEVSKHKNFLLCKRCIDLVTLFNKIVHQKYQVFISCANKVQEKRTMDPAKDTTVILNELLADEPWISQVSTFTYTHFNQCVQFIVE